ncbi:MAG: acetate kinase [Betaproteobacteria bacterium RBG_16_64_18]|nr:MAG: acetate kinase [Betaproteobacteria bacterium RBG_16_64_18]OGA38380.1 MAG: acetate kinase [Betaproteobacteria bacterium RIFCSPLOWO2_12_FULL_65_110]
MSSAVLVLNSGSSSVKFALYRAAGADAKQLFSGQIDNIEYLPQLSLREASGETSERKLKSFPGPGRTRAEALSFLIDMLSQRAGGAGILAAGHRVVHGGAKFREPVLVDRDVLAVLETFIPLAPLHQPHNLAAIRALLDGAPGLPQIACFDTAFHTTQPRLATLYALPRELEERGLRRYGFHGLSYEYIASVLPDYLADGAQGRVLVAHLGNGSSLCAMRERRSIATSMGFTAVEGLVMGTRPGSLDPGVLLYLLQEMRMDAAAVSDLLYHRCGLLGVSGISHDMRVLLASTEPRAAEAVDLYVYRAVTQAGGLVAALDGLDALVFTAGIGEHAAPVRERICRGLAWLGLEFDPAANARDGPRISREGSPVSAWVIPTNEELMIARHTLQVIGQTGS